MKNICLFISAFIPMYLLIILKLVVEIINKNLTFNVLNTIMLVLNITLILIGIFGLIWNIKSNKEKSVEITVIEAQNLTDQHFLGYFSLFVLFALTFDLSKVAMFLVSVVIMIFIGIVYVCNSMYYINPFLNVLGFKFYKITYKLANDNGEMQELKLFYKGNKNLIGKTLKVKLKNKHFSFIDTNNK